MSIDRRSRRPIVRLYLYPLLASVAILLTLAFGAGVMARPLIIPEKPEVPPGGWGGFPSPTPIPSLTPTPYGPAALLPLPPFTPTPLSIPPGPYVLLLASSVPLRAGPGVLFETLRLGMRDQGFSLLGISPDSQWWAVNLPDMPQTLAWIERRSTVAYHATELPVIYPPLSLPGVYPVTETHMMVLAESTIRTGPGVTFPAIGSAAPGQWFRLAGASADKLWMAVSIDGVSGQLGWLRADAGNIY